MGLTHSPRIATDGLILCLDAGNVRSYPGSGTSWTDLSRNKYNTTISSGSFNTSNGGSINFNGATQCVLDVDSFVRDYEAYTFDSFFYIGTSNAGAHFNMMNVPNSDSQSDGFWHHLNLTSNTWYWRTEDNVNGEKGGTVGDALPAGSWYHVSIVVKTNQLLFYVNGNLYKSINTLFNWSSLRTDRTVYLVIGKGYNYSYGFTGKISTFYMYSTELSPEQIRQNYLATKGRFNL